MGWMKRNVALLAVLAAMLVPSMKLLAAGEAGAAPHTGAVVLPAHGDEAASEPDERLVPIPPSRDTIVSALWVIIIFVVMLTILYPTAWKNVLAGLKAREQKIRGDIESAEAANAKALASVKEYQAQLATAEAKVRDILAQASADAEKVAAGIKLRSQQETEEIKERANREIEASKNQALKEIYAQTAELSTSIAEKILRRNLNADDQKDLVARSLEQLQAINKN